MNLFECILKRFDKSARGLLGANDGLLPANSRLPRANHNNMRWNNSKRRVLSLGN